MNLHNLHDTRPPPDAANDDRDTLGGMVVIGYALSALFGAAVATVFWAVVWVLTRQ